MPAKAKQDREELARLPLVGMTATRFLHNDGQADLDGRRAKLGGKYPMAMAG